MIHLVLDYQNRASYVIGFLAISMPLYILFRLSGGRAIGGGDIKLMAAAGLLLGWKQIILAFVAGCIAGSVIHIIRMRVANAERTLALGPYLSLGILFVILWGDAWIQAYIGCFS
jgi:leader peptidase (prepilin peptidase)/N-methyltransferase